MDDVHHILSDLLMIGMLPKTDVGPIGFSLWMTTEFSAPQSGTCSVVKAITEEMAVKVAKAALSASP